MSQNNNTTIGQFEDEAKNNAQESAIENKNATQEQKIERAKEVAQEKSAAEREGAYQKILGKVKGTNTSDDDTVKVDAGAVGQKEDREGQIQNLVDLATTKGVIHAVKVARTTEDFYVLDQFHDRLLADELHDALVAKGLLEK